MEYTSQSPENKLKRELSLETAKISGVDTIEQLESNKRIDSDLPTEAPGEINPESLEMDVIPEGYDFRERLKQEPIPPRNFLPDEINRKILRKFYDLFKILYELSSGDLITSFTMANIILLGSKFVTDLINNLLHLDKTSFLFSQGGMKAMVNLYVPDEEYEDFLIRKNIREAIIAKQHSITQLLKSLPSNDISNVLEECDINKGTINMIQRFTEYFSARGSLVSENLESFAENGVVKLRNGSGLYSLLFSHNFRANRSSTDGEPIYKLLDELMEEENREILKELLEDKTNKTLMNSLFHVLLLFSLLSPEIKNSIVLDLPQTMSAADIRKSRGITMPSVTYMDRIPSFFQVNTDLFKYIMKKCPKYRLTEFKDNLYKLLSNDGSKEDFNRLIEEFTKNNIEYHEKVFKGIIKKEIQKQKSKRKAAFKKKKKSKPTKYGKQKGKKSAKSKKSGKSGKSGKSAKGKKSGKSAKGKKSAKAKKSAKGKKSDKSSKGVKGERVIRIGDSVEIHYN